MNEPANHFWSILRGNRLGIRRNMFTIGSEVPLITPHEKKTASTPSLSLAPHFFTWVCISEDVMNSFFTPRDWEYLPRFLETAFAFNARNSRPIYDFDSIFYDSIISVTANIYKYQRICDDIFVIRWKRQKKCLRFEKQDGALNWYISPSKFLSTFIYVFCNVDKHIISFSSYAQQTVPFRRKLRIYLNISNRVVETTLNDCVCVYAQAIQSFDSVSLLNLRRPALFH